MSRSESGQLLRFVNRAKSIFGSKQDGPASIKHQMDYILGELKQQRREGKLSIGGVEENHAHLKGGRLTSMDIYIAPRPSLAWDDSGGLNKFARELFKDSESIDEDDLQYELKTMTVAVHPAGDRAQKPYFRVYRREDVVIGETKDGSAIKKPLRTRIWAFPNKKEANARLKYDLHNNKFGSKSSHDTWDDAREGTDCRSD